MRYGWIPPSPTHAATLTKVAACVGLGGIHGTKSMSPNLFLPLDMCGCRPGYAGTGTNCSVCPANTFNSRNNQTSCQPYPPKSSTDQSSYQLATTKEACRCSYGLVGEQNSELVLRMKPSAKLMTENTVYPAANITRNA